jgi:hypothetical protein
MIIDVPSDFDFERFFSQANEFNLGDDVNIERPNKSVIKGHVWTIRTINKVKTLEIKLSSFVATDSLYFIQDSNNVWCNTSDKRCKLSLSKKFHALHGDPSEI